MSFKHIKFIPKLSQTHQLIALKNVYKYLNLYYQIFQKNEVVKIR